MVGKKLTSFYGVKEFLDTIGDGAFDIVKICEAKPMVTDEEINKKLKKFKITEIRAKLNQLHYRGIANYERTKNMKTGWYTYKWHVRTKRVTELLFEKHKEDLEKLENKKSFEANYSFFSCEKNCNSFPFEVAAEYSFRCPGCGNTMNLIDNTKRLKDITGKIETIKKELIELKFVA